MSISFLVFIERYVLKSSQSRVKFRSRSVSSDIRSILIKLVKFSQHVVQNLSWKMTLRYNFRKFVCNYFKGVVKIILQIIVLLVLSTGFAPTADVAFVILEILVFAGVYYKLLKMQSVSRSVKKLIKAQNSVKDCSILFKALYINYAAGKMLAHAWLHNTECDVLLFRALSAILAIYVLLHHT